MKTKHKVFGYITRANQLLVFSHTDHPDAGIQIPAGTVENNETIEEAIIREASEETGLKDISIVKFLGKTEYLNENNNELYIRHFFHLKCSDEKLNLDKWEHGEKNSIEHFTDIDRVYGMIRFSFYWVDIANADNVLNSGHGAMLKKIKF